MKAERGKQFYITVVPSEEEAQWFHRSDQRLRRKKLSELVAPYSPEIVLQRDEKAKQKRRQSTRRNGHWVRRTKYSN